MHSPLEFTLKMTDSTKVRPRGHKVTPVAWSRMLRFAESVESSLYWCQTPLKERNKGGIKKQAEMISLTHYGTLRVPG